MLISFNWSYITKASKLFLQPFRQKSFSQAIAEALQEMEHCKEIKEMERANTMEKVQNLKVLKKNIKKKKWVDYNTTEESDVKDNKRKLFNPAERVKRKKCVILMGYSGINYFGMQRNPGMSTIEEELFQAMLKQKWITQDSFEQPQNASFQRAARTDKGVSAARQVCSIKLPESLDINAINKDLPKQIRIFGVRRVTKGFNSKDQCNARTYSYTLPTISFACFDVENDLQSYRIDDNTLEKVSEILKMYEGTKNFHNFTSKKNYHDPSANRFIMSFTNSEPFLSVQGIEYLKMKVKGQSFMLHQIRKMIGLVIAIVRGHTTATTFHRAFTEERLDLPMAPGLGLVLDTVHYERYNERYGGDGVHEPLIWDKLEAEINEFIDKYINANIFETEFKERPMLEWLETLSMHSYDARRDDVLVIENKNKYDVISNED